MLNLIQHLTKSKTYETLKQVQGDRLGFFTLYLVRWRIPVFFFDSPSNHLF